MSRIKVVCCSCFIEKCVCFCQTKCNFDKLMSTNSDIFFVFKVKMQIIMNYFAGKDQKYLLWTIDEDVIPKCFIIYYTSCSFFLFLFYVMIY